MRVMPTLVIAPVLAGFLHTVGNYGIHHNIDKILGELQKNVKHQEGSVLKLKVDSFMASLEKDS